MSYISTVDLLAAVKAALEVLALDPTNDPSGAKLFDAVACYNLRDPAKALDQIFLTQEQRVAFIVAGGDAYQANGGRDQVSVVSHRDTDFEIMLCDRVWEKADPAAVLGGDENVGVLLLKDRVVAALQGQSLELAGVVLLPREGGIMDLFDPRGNEQGRTFWSQQFTTYAGREKLAVT